MNDNIKDLIRTFLESQPLVEPVQKVTEKAEMPKGEMPEGEKAEKPKRCQHLSCKTKLMLSDFACKCENYYCSSHRHAESHSCSFDFKKQSHLQLEKQLVKVVSSKLDRV